MTKQLEKKIAVQDTLVLPIYGRKVAMELYPDLFHDSELALLIQKIDHSVNYRSKYKNKVAGLLAATRQFDLAEICRRYLRKCPRACVVNLGCGLDNTFHQVNNGLAKGYNLDFPDVIKLRNELLPPIEGERNIPCDLNDKQWFREIEFKKEDGAVFIASGVFYYFRRKEVEVLLSQLSMAFPRGKIAFDATNQRGLKKMVKTWLKPQEMGNINVYFSLDEIKELEDVSSSFAKITTNGSLSGYRPLDKRYGLLTNAIFRYIEKSGLAQMIEIDFK